MALLDEFSAGYYVGQFFIEPYEGDHAVMDRAQHEEANEQIYTTGEDIERVDHPLIMKEDESHFPVLAADQVASDTLGLPADLLAATRVEKPPTVKAVLVAKADRAAQLLEWFTPYTVNALTTPRTVVTAGVGGVACQFMDHRHDFPVVLFIHGAAIAHAGVDTRRRSQVHGGGTY